MTHADEIVEEWRGIPGFDERFEASSLGRIRRIYDSGGTAIVAQSVSNKRAGRMTVSVIQNGSMKRVRRTTARLVLLAFEGEPPGDPDEWKALHVNDNVTDDRLENLRWAEWSESTMKGWARRATKYQKIAGQLGPLQPRASG